MAIAMVIAPFRDPADDTVHWSAIWSPPRYELESMRSIVTPEVMSQVPDIVSADFVRNSTTKPMRLHHVIYRRIILLTGMAIIACWFVLPGWIEQTLYRMTSGRTNQ
jgi:hypothetical protein